MATALRFFFASFLVCFEFVACVCVCVCFFCLFYEDVKEVVSEKKGICSSFGMVWLFSLMIFGFEHPAVSSRSKAADSSSGRGLIRVKKKLRRPLHWTWR